MTKANLNQIINSLFPSSLLRTNASNELEYVAPGTVGQILGVDALGVLNYIDPVNLITVQNGLTESGVDLVELGGTLLRNTSIDQATFDLDLLNGNFNSTNTPSSALTPYNLTISNNLLGFGIDFGGAYTVDATTTNLYWNGLRINPSFGQESSLGWTDFSNSQSYISANASNFNILRINGAGANTAWIQGSDTGLLIDSPVRLDIKTPLYSSKLAGDVLTLVNPLTGEVEYQSIPTIKWYAENAAYPATAPVSGGIGSIALGDGAEAIGSNCFVVGFEAGKTANIATSVFMGTQAGFGTQLFSSFFVGGQSGYGATNASESVFLGTSSGYSAINAEQSVFIGNNAGSGATSSGFSVFLGKSAGTDAVNANSSIFIGTETGTSATNANNSLFIGQYAGTNDTVNNSAGDSSILIGNETSTGGFSNSIALGRAATNTASNQFMIGSASGTIYDIVNPAYPDNRDDSSITTPTNFLYTDVNGKLLSTTLAQIVASRTKDTQTVTGTTVTLPSTPNVATLDVYKNGLLQEELVDYTVAGAVITFIVPLVTEKITSIYFV
jgi:hypothetical protein